MGGDTPARTLRENCATQCQKTETGSSQPQEALVHRRHDLSTPEGREFLAMFSGLGERERIIKRTHEGRRIAMADMQTNRPPGP